MSKKKTPKKSAIKWPTVGEVTLREREHKAKGAIAKNNAHAKKLKKLIRLDAMSRLPMPSHSNLAAEIAAAHAAPKLVAGSLEAQADKENWEKTNAAWDQVAQLREFAAIVIGVPSMIAPFARGELLQHIPKLEQSVFARVCRGLAGDTVEYVKLMNEILKRHEGKTGNAVSMVDRETANMAFSEYVNLFELWMESTLPLIEHMTALLQSGLSALAVENEPLATELSRGINDVIDRMGQAILASQATPETDAYVKEPNV